MSNIFASQDSSGADLLIEARLRLNDLYGQIMFRSFPGRPSWIARLRALEASLPDKDACYELLHLRLPAQPGESKLEI